MVLPTNISDLVTVMLIGFAGELHHTTTLDKTKLPGHVSHGGNTYAWAYLSKGRHVYKQMMVMAL